MATDWRDEQAALDHLAHLADELRAAGRRAEADAVEWAVGVFLDEAFTEEDIRRFEEKPAMRLAEPHVVWRGVSYWPHEGQRPAPPREGGGG
jgi:hypothetical protein